ncbi:MAG: lipocalin family protein [Odoribacter sp.]
MTNKWITLILLLSGFYTNSFANSPENKIVGKWYNPHTYRLSGNLKGFQFKKNGNCKALGIATLKLDRWEIKNDSLIITGYSITPEGKQEAYRSEEKICQLTSDSLGLVATRAQIKFLYLSPKELKAKVTAPTKEKK